MDRVGCSGSESSLADCSHDGWGRHHCDHGDDVSIECAVPMTTAPVNGKLFPQVTQLDCVVSNEPTLYI